MKPGEPSKLANFGFAVLIFLLVLFSISLSFMLNIAIHEAGHYMAAQAFGLDASMHFYNPLTGEDGQLNFDIRRLNAEPVAYTLFSPTTDTWENVNIILAGVLANLFFAVFVLFVYSFFEPTPLAELMFLCFAIPALISVLINLNVFSAASDGAVLLRLLV